LQLCKQTERRTPTDSLAWSKTYQVLAISRLYLHHSLRFSKEAVESLTDEEMQQIADVLIAHYFDHEFDEDVKFLVACKLVEKSAGKGKAP
jgi:hypothetical protein